MDFAVASPGFVAVGADLAARIVLFGALGDADALGGILLDLADATGTAVDASAGVICGGLRCKALNGVCFDSELTDHANGFSSFGQAMLGVVFRCQLSGVFVLALQVFRLNFFNNYKFFQELQKIPTINDFC